MRFRFFVLVMAVGISSVSDYANVNISIKVTKTELILNCPPKY